MDKLPGIVVGRNRTEQIDLSKADAHDKLSTAIQKKNDRVGSRDRAVRIGVHTSKDGTQVLYIRKQNWKDTMRDALGIGKRLDQNLKEAKAYIQARLSSTADPQGKPALNTVGSLIDSLSTGQSMKFGELTTRMSDIGAINKTNSAYVSAQPAQVEKRMEAYKENMKEHQKQAHQQLHTHFELNRCLGNSQMRVYSNLTGAGRDAMAFRRDLVNIGMRRHFSEEVNAEILGCKTSHARAGTDEVKTALQPGNQLSLAMRTPWMRSDETVVHPVVLSVSAPALDERSQPEWDQYVEYVDKKQKLRTDAYQTAYETLCDHIKQCARHHPGHRVVLSAVGTENFLGRLIPGNKTQALNIASTAFANMIVALRTQGKEVSFSDIHPDSPFWKSVNNKLAQADSGPIACLGTLPGDWLTDTDILVNAWDPHSIVGNGCALDNSFDGYVGRSSLCHDMHTLACVLHSEGLAALDADGRLQVTRQAGEGA